MLNHLVIEFARVNASFVHERISIFIGLPDRVLNISRSEIAFVHFTIMASVAFIHSEETIAISILKTMIKSSLFHNNPTLILLVSPYPIQFPVSFSVSLYLSPFSGRLFSR
jgi:hypothetical protein